MQPTDLLHPTALPLGTQVGLWQVRGRVGEGTYGTVYRVIRAGASEDKPLALKLASHPEDPRFEREAELLRRIQHPGVPRLYDQGSWTGQQGLVFPFFVMEWVEGVPLYDWARAHPPTSREVLRVLAQVARALEATHSVGCLHRDVKGDNVRVDGTGRAVLVDFGSGIHPGARPLTREIFPPDTPPYRSPQALRFQWRFRRHRSARYPVTPSDDVYALGVTAYRLCTGTYPSVAVDLSSEEGPNTGTPLVPPSVLATVCLPLEALILRMLADSPETRGTAAQLVEALDAAAESAGPEADRRVAPRSGDVPTGRKAGPELRRRWRQRVSWLTATAVGVLLAIAVGRWDQHRLRSHAKADAGGQEETPTGLADTTLDAPLPAMPEPVRKGVSLEVPKQPLPGQRRPPCPARQVEIHGGCWLKVDVGGPPCGEDAYEWKGKCFDPVAAPQRPTTAE